MGVENDPGGIALTPFDAQCTTIDEQGKLEFLSGDGNSRSKSGFSHPPPTARGRDQDTILALTNIFISRLALGDLPAAVSGVLHFL